MRRAGIVVTLAAGLVVLCMSAAAALGAPVGAGASAALGSPTAIEIETSIDVYRTSVCFDSAYTLINRSDRPQPIRLVLGLQQEFWGIDFGDLDYRTGSEERPTSLPASLTTENRDDGQVWLVGEVPADAEVWFVARTSANLLTPDGSGWARLRELTMERRYTVYNPPSGGDWPLTGLLLHVDLPIAGVTIPNDPRRGPEGKAIVGLGQPVWRSSVNRLCIRTGAGAQSQVSYPEPTGAPAVSDWASPNVYDTSPVVWELSDLVCDQAVTYDLYIAKPVVPGIPAGWAAVLGAGLAAAAFSVGARWQRRVVCDVAGVPLWRSRTGRLARLIASACLLLLIILYASVQLYWGYRSPVTSSGWSRMNADYVAEAWQPGQPVNFTIGLVNRSRFPARITAIRVISLGHGCDLPLAGAYTTSQDGYAGVGPLEARQLVAATPTGANVGIPAIGANIAERGKRDWHGIILSVDRPPDLAAPIDIGEIEITYSILGVRHHAYAHLGDFGAPAPGHPAGRR